MVAGRLRAWLEWVFFGGSELAVLSTPSFVVAVFAQEVYPDAIPLAGLTAIVAGSVGIAAFRADSPDVGEWPRRAELTSLPLRVGYFSLLFFLAAIGVAHVAVSVEALWLTLLGGVVQLIGLAAFPTLYRSVYGEPVRNPTHRL